MERKIARFGENHLVGSEVFVETDNGKAHATRNLLAVCKDRSYVLLLTFDADSLQCALEDPSVFAPGINKELLHNYRPPSIDEILDLTFRVERSHRLD